MKDRILLLLHLVHVAIVLSYVKNHSTNRPGTIVNAAIVLLSCTTTHSRNRWGKTIHCDAATNGFSSNFAS